MTSKQQPKHGTIAVSLRVPPDLDQIVNNITFLERRKKNAVISLALEEYTARHHPELLESYRKALEQHGDRAQAATSGPMRSAVA